MKALSDNLNVMLISIDQEPGLAQKIGRPIKDYLEDVLEAIERNTIPEREAFRKSLGLPPRHFKIHVDGRAVNEVIEEIRFDSVNSRITAENLAPEPAVGGEIILEIFSRKRMMSCSNVLEELKRRKSRPARIGELLAFVKEYPNLARQITLVALGTKFVLSRECYPYVEGDGEHMDLMLGSGTSVWACSSRFLAVVQS